MNPKGFIKRLFTSIIKDDFPGMASEMAYSFILTLFPFLIFLVAVFGVLGTETQVDQVLTSIGGVVPSSVQVVIESVLKGVISTSSGSLLTIGLFITLFAASNAMFVLIKGLNRAFKVEETRPYWYTRGLSILMVIVNVLVLFIGANLIIFGRIIMNILLSFIHIPYHVINTVLFVRWPIVFMAMFTMAFLNYYFMPNVHGDNEIRVKSTFPGALFFCIFWLLASWGFSLYVDNFGRYNEVYGTLAAFTVLLIWLYYTSLIILIGGEINSQVYASLSKKRNSEEDTSVQQ